MSTQLTPATGGPPRPLGKKDMERPLGSVSTAKQVLDQLGPEIRKVLARQLDPERFMRITVSCLQRNPKLLDADGASFVRAVMEAAQLGLELDSSFGYAYLVPFRDRRSGKTLIQLIPGYRGLIDLARRSGQVRDFYAYPVREGDEFTVELGLDRKIVHRPKMDFAGELTLVYAVARFPGGETDFEVMSRRQVDAIRARSKAGNDGPWVTDYDEMARKTVIKRLSKRLPLSAEFRRAVELDDEQFREREEERHPRRREMDLSDVMTRRGETEQQLGAAASLMDAVSGAAGEPPSNGGEAAPEDEELKALRGALTAKAQKAKLIEIGPPPGRATCLIAATEEIAEIAVVELNQLVLLAELDAEQMEKIGVLVDEYGASAKKRAALNLAGGSHG